MEEFGPYFQKDKARKKFSSRIENGDFPFQAFILPDKDGNGNKIYCRDIANPIALLELNHEIARGAIQTKLLDPGCDFWKRIEGARSGYKGTSSSNVDPGKIISPENIVGNIGPLIGSHSNVTSEVDYLTVIRDYSTIAAKSISASLIFGGNDKQSVFIGEGWDISNCIIVGPVKMERYTEYKRLGRNPQISKSIIYPNWRHPDNWVDVPLNKNFAEYNEPWGNGDK